MSWLDVLIVVLVLWSVVAGARKGLLRIGICFAATLAGFVLAAWFYRLAGGWLQPMVGSRIVANLLGFLMVFAAVLTAGAILSWLLEKMLKLAKLTWLDRIFGAAFGAVRGVLFATVLVFLLVAFAPKGPPRFVLGSAFAPYVIDASRWLAAMTPNELKAGFRNSYAEIKKFWAEVHRRKKKPPTEETI